MPAGETRRVRRETGDGLISSAAPKAKELAALPSSTEKRRGIDPGPSPFAFCPVVAAVLRNYSPPPRRPTIHRSTIEGSAGHPRPLPRNSLHRLLLLLLLYIFVFFLFFFCVSCFKDKLDSVTVTEF